MYETAIGVLQDKLVDMEGDEKSGQLNYDQFNKDASDELTEERGKWQLFVNMEASSK